MGKYRQSQNVTPSGRKAIYITNGAFQELKPDTADTLISKNPFSMDNQEGNRTQNPSTNDRHVVAKNQPEPGVYNLATRSQLKHNTVMGPDHKIGMIGGQRDFHCEKHEYDPCYRIDEKTREKIYYTCINGDHCHEIRLNDKNGIYLYAKNITKPVSQRITTNPGDLLCTRPRLSLYAHFIAIAHCAFQGKKPRLFPIIMRPSRMRRSPQKHDDNPGNRPQKTAVKRYQLATQSHLENKNNIILDANNQPITMETIPDFHCQENSPCYRLDNKTGEKIYYTCVSIVYFHYAYCREIRLNHTHAVYLYLDENYNIRVSYRQSQHVTPSGRKAIYITDGAFQEVKPDIADGAFQEVKPDIADSAFQEKNPATTTPRPSMYQHPLRQGGRIRTTYFEHSNNPGNPSQKTAVKRYQLATQRQLQNKIILDANNQTTTMGGIRNFHCQKNGLCYRFDAKMGEKIYYICNNSISCHEIRLNDKNGIYLYTDVSGRITNNASDLMHAAPPFIAIAHCVFQEENPHLLPIIIRPRTRRSPKKHGNHPGNRPQKTPLDGYQLATKSQLRQSTNLINMMLGIRYFYCQKNGPCYRLDEKTVEKIYYLCKRNNDDDYYHCYEVILNDDDTTVSWCITHNPNYLINAALLLYYITNDPFQGKKPEINPSTIAPRTRRSSQKHGNNPGNRPQKTAVKRYQLATQSQLQNKNNVILDTNNQPIAMETIPDFHCQENSPCYRLDEKTREAIYYTCVDNDENYCHEIRLNHAHEDYFYVDENYTIRVSIANHNPSCLASGKQRILPMALFRK